ncbi:unnamed protein product [Discosporangium mesarthrocarpum]
MLGLLGFPLAATYQIPWSIVTATTSRALHSEEKALYATTFNLSQCLPEILMALLGGPIVEIFNGQVSAALAMGGVGGFLGAVLCFWVIEPEELYKGKHANIRQVPCGGVNQDKWLESAHSPATLSPNSGNAIAYLSGNGDAAGRRAEVVDGNNPMVDFEPRSPHQGESGPVVGPLGGLGVESGQVV